MDKEKLKAYGVDHRTCRCIDNGFSERKEDEKWIISMHSG